MQGSQNDATVAEISKLCSTQECAVWTYTEVSITIHIKSINNADMSKHLLKY